VTIKEWRADNMKKLLGGLLFVLLVVILLSININAVAPGIKEVVFKYEPQVEEVSSVYLAGSFNNWATKDFEMKDQDNDGVYEITIPLKPGTYQYKFVINGTTWRKDPHSEDYTADGFGGLNSVINVGQQIEREGEVGDGEIIKNALWHDQTTTAHITRTQENIIEIRFQTAVNDVEAVRLNYFDEDGYQVEYMNFLTYDGQFDYWHKKIEVKDDSFKYRFVIDDADTRYWYGKNGIAITMADWFKFNKEDSLLFNSPEWIKQAVFYQIFPERFSNGNKENDPEYIETYKNNEERYKNIVPDWHQGIKASDHHYIDSEKFTDDSNQINPKSGWHVLYGGDIQGIENNLNYLTDLGINTIYLNPIFESTSNHKYNSSTYEFIDDNFAIKDDPEASNQLFIDFIKTAHQHGIRIILDGVFNHTGYEHYAFQDVVSKGRNSKYWNWYYIESYPITTLYEQRTQGKEPNYQCWAGFGSLPKINVNNEEVREYIYDITKEWMDPNGDGNPKDGIDGWRLDVPTEVKDRNPEFWIDWRGHVKDINPDAYIAGEIWGDASQYLKGNEFDGVMNYRFRDAVLKLLNESWTINKFIDETNKIKAEYPTPAFNSLLNLIGSHDTERFLNAVGKDINKFKKAVFFQFIFPGAPMVYYGDEIAMAGGQDPDNRRTMIWQKRPYSNKPNDQLLEFYKKLIQLRHANNILKEGRINLSIQNNKSNVLIIERELNEEKIIGLVNISDQAEEISLEVGKDEIINLLTDRKYQAKNGQINITIESDELLLLK